MKACRIQLEILQERIRQQEREGFSDAHDDEHDAGELACAATCYALNAANELHPQSQGDGDWKENPPEQWPWSRNWWKPKSPRQDLIRAAALIVAEIERLDREADKAGQQPN